MWYPTHEALTSLSRVWRVWYYRLTKIFILTLAILLFSGCTTQLNHAAWFGWSGYADTDLEMGDFFDDNHTMSVWFMPRYRRTYEGPILSNSGYIESSSFPTFYVGIGRYAKSAMVFNFESGKWERIGQPLVIKVGDDEVYYTPSPALEQERWYHIAVTRKGCTFRLYLDGVLLETDTEEEGLVLDCSGLVAGSNDSVAGGVENQSGDGQFKYEHYEPSIMALERLRIGRTDSHFARNRSNNSMVLWPQFFGLIDDVAVFSRALTQQEIQGLVDHKRLDGSEPALLVGWTFDSETPDGEPLPDKLNRSIWLSTKTPGLSASRRILVSDDRDSDVETGISAQLPAHFTSHELPIPDDQVWKISQGYGGRASHNSDATFSLDMTTYSGGVNNSYDQLIYATAGGYVLDVQTGDPDCDQGTLRWRTEPGEEISSLHMVYNPNFELGDPIPNGGLLHRVGIWEEDNGECISKGSHIHISAQAITRGTDFSIETYNTIPVAFRDFKVANSENGPWEYVEIGELREGSFVRRASSR